MCLLLWAVILEQAVHDDGAGQRSHPQAALHQEHEEAHRNAGRRDRYSFLAFSDPKPSPEGVDVGDAALVRETGITPMLQVLEEVLSEQDDHTHVCLLFANTTEQDIILKDRLDALAKKHPNFEVHYIVSRPSKSWTGYNGHITADLIKKHFPGISSCLFFCLLYLLLLYWLA